MYGYRPWHEVHARFVFYTTLEQPPVVKVALPLCAVFLKGSIPTTVFSRKPPNMIRWPHYLRHRFVSLLKVLVSDQQNSRGSFDFRTGGDGSSRCVCQGGNDLLLNSEDIIHIVFNFIKLSHLGDWISPIHRMCISYWASWMNIFELIIVLD